MTNTLKIAVLPGDEPGREMMFFAVQLLEYVLEQHNIPYTLQFGELGSVAFEQSGTPLPSKTVELCRTSHAALVGFAGSHESSDLPFNMRPEAGLLNLRKRLGIYANIKRVKVEREIFDLSPLKVQTLEKGIDIAVVRELTGGIYYGKKGLCEVDGRPGAFDTEVYTEQEIERILRRAFSIAVSRNKHLICADKANLLETSQLWRKISAVVAQDFAEVHFDHMYIDDLAADLLKHPERYDVIVTSNLFGDILSDEVSGFTGVKSLIPSASFGQGNFGIYSPVAASFSDGSVKVSASMTSAILAVALMCRFSLSLPDQANLIEQAVYHTLDRYRTADIASSEKEIVSNEGLFHRIFDTLKLLSSNV